MRRAFTVGFLTLMLLGSFAVQAKAAEALAISLAELIHPDVIEPGDRDNPVAWDLALKIPTQFATGHLSHSLAVFEGFTGSLVHLPSGFVPTSRLCEDPPWPSRHRARRLASIQAFLC